MEHERNMKQTVLKISGLKVAYGGIQAVKGVDLEIADGELVTLIGANGAGKTTTMKAITGLQGWAGGDVEYMASPSRACRATTCSSRVWRWCRKAAACSRA